MPYFDPKCPMHLFDYKAQNTDKTFWPFQNELVLHDVTSGLTLLRVPCGGGHRSWDMQMHGPNHHQVALVYVKSRDLVVCEAELTLNQLLLRVIIMIIDNNNN